MGFRMAVAGLLTRAAGVIRGRSWTVAKPNRINAKLHASAKRQYSDEMWRSNGRKLQDIARHLVRNHPVAAVYADYGTAKILGKDGLWPRFDTGNEALDSALENRFWEWAQAVDSRGELTWNTLQAVLCRDYLITGEAFAVTSSDAKRGLVVDPIETEQLNGTSPTSALTGGDYAANGIVWSASGKKVGYLIDTKKPDGFSVLSQIETTPADRVIHIYERNRPSQTRGESPFDAVAQSLFDLDDINNAELQTIKTAAFLGLWLKTDPMQAPGANLDSLGVDGDVDDPEVASSGYESSATNPDDIVLAPGLVQTGPETPHLMDVKRPSGEYQAFHEKLTRMICARLAIPYAAIDSTAQNYSGSRTEEMHARARWRRKQGLFVDSCIRPLIYRWLLQEVLLGRVAGLRAQDVSRIARSVKVPLPAWDWVDPEAELKALRGKIDLGIIPWGVAVAESGYDPRDVRDGFVSDDKLMSGSGVTIPKPGFDSSVPPDAGTTQPPDTNPNTASTQGGTADVAA